MRSSKQNQVHSSIVSTLLSLMDGLNDLGSIFVIGATTRVEAVDPALRRPGRFDKEIYIGLPNFRARTQILRQIIDCWGRGFLSDSDLFSISEKCNGFSPADIKALCSEAVLHAIRRNYPELVDSPSKEELIEFDPESVSIHVMDLQFGYDKLKSRIQSQSAMSRHSPVPLPESAPANLLVAYQNALQHFSLKDISEDLRAEEMKAFPQLELLVRSPCIYLMIHGDGNIGQEEVALALLDRLDVPVVVCDFECLLLGHSSLVRNIFLHSCVTLFNYICSFLSLRESQVSGASKYASFKRLPTEFYIYPVLSCCGSTVISICVMLWKHPCMISAGLKNLIRFVFS